MKQTKKEIRKNNVLYVIEYLLSLVLGISFSLSIFFLGMWAQISSEFLNNIAKIYMIAIIIYASSVMTYYSFKYALDMEKKIYEEKNSIYLKK